MGKINIDFKAGEFINQSKMSEYAAEQALLLVAKHIRKGDASGAVLPINVAEWLASAIEKSMVMPSEMRARALTDELGLTNSPPRPAGEWIKVGKYIEDQIESGKSKSQARGLAEQKYRISAGTAKKYYKIYEQALEEANEVQRKTDEEERSK